MLDQSFSAKNFRRLLRPGDFSKTTHNLPTDKAQLDHRLSSVQAKYDNGNVDIGSIIRVNVRGIDAFTAGSLEVDLVLRKLNDNLRRLYSIKQPDRNQIVGQLIELVRDGTPIQITRRDIRRFYESVPRHRVLGKIQDDYLLSAESKKLLRDLFNSPALAKRPGLPRGLAISSTLAELYLRTLDRAVKRTDGVLYYARYVDDIIVISFEKANDVCEKIEAELSSLGLDLNLAKSPPTLQLPYKSKNACECELSCNCGKAVEYLGYSLGFPKPNVDWDKKRDGRFVSVSLSDSKKSRTKSRMARAFAAYCSSSNFELLEKRIAYLTSNYPLPLNKFKKGLKGGVYYHYPLVDDLGVLRELDEFSRSLIFARRGSIGRRLDKMLSLAQRRRLRKYSFVKGFTERYFVKFTPKELSAISQCWKHA